MRLTLQPWAYAVRKCWLHNATKMWAVVAEVAQKSMYNQWDSLSWFACAAKVVVVVAVVVQAGVSLYRV